MVILNNLPTFFIIHKIIFRWLTLPTIIETLWKGLKRWFTMTHKIHAQKWAVEKSSSWLTVQEVKSIIVGDARQQVVGGAGSWEITSQPHTGNWESELEVGWGYKLSNTTSNDILPPSIPNPKYPLNSPKKGDFTTNWGPSIQISEPRGYISHSNDHTSLVENPGSILNNHVW